MTLPKSSDTNEFAWLTSARDDAAVELLEAALSAGISPRHVIVVARPGARVRQIERLCNTAKISFCSMAPPAKVPTHAAAWLEGIPDQTVRQDVQERLVRSEFDRRLLKELLAAKCRVVMMVGYMRMVTSVLRSGSVLVLNLHPSPPQGPVGKWQDVIWSSIAIRARLAGAMIHVATDDPDRGPVLSYCTVGIDDNELSPLWKGLDVELASKNLDEIARERGEAHPLFRSIRQRQFLREGPLIIATLRRLIRGELKIEGQSADGLCLNEDVERIVAGFES